MKAPRVMRETAMRIRRSDRRQAMILMESVFKARLKTLRGWDDFNPSDHIEMSAEAASAEALYKFA